MGNVVKFQAQGKEYQLSIIDADGGRWITAQQLGEAMGAQHYRKTLQYLRENGEIKKDVHYRDLMSRRQSDGKMSRQTVLSYRGVIRVAMRSQGARARLFRDWAEEVLFQVMMTGGYRSPEEDRVMDAYRAGHLVPVGWAEEWRDRMIAARMAEIAGRTCVGADGWRRIQHYRRLGLTQPETAKLLDCTRWVVGRLEITAARLAREYDIRPVMLQAGGGAR